MRNSTQKQKISPQRDLKEIEALETINMLRMATDLSPMMFVFVFLIVIVNLVVIIGLMKGKQS